jgi:hypothetical protein
MVGTKDRWIYIATWRLAKTWEIIKLSPDQRCSCFQNDLLTVIVKLPRSRNEISEAHVEDGTEAAVVVVEVMLGYGTAEEINGALEDGTMIVVKVELAVDERIDGTIKVEEVELAAAREHESEGVALVVGTVGTIYEYSGAVLEDGCALELLGVHEYAKDAMFS